MDYPKLNTDDAFPNGEMSRAMGWGTTSSGGSSSNVLREVDLPVITNGECDSRYSQYDIYANNICTFQPGKDSCQGDSGKLCKGCLMPTCCFIAFSYYIMLSNILLYYILGGPLIIPGATASEDTLIGVVSWGIGCATSQYPGVYLYMLIYFCF